MPTIAVDDIKAKMRHELEAAKAISQKAIDDNNRDMTNDELSTVATHIKTYEGLKAELSEQTNQAQVKAALDALSAETGLERTPEQQKATPDAFRQPSKFKTIGEMFVESLEFKSMMAPFGDRVPGSQARIQSAPFGVKALVTGLADSSGGAFITNERQADLELLGRRPLTIRDLVSKRNTTSDTVEFVQQTVQTNAAAAVPEATSAAAPTTGASSGAALVNNPGGGYKPEGQVAYQVVTATVRTLAEWIPATKRSLADASQLRGLIDQELRDDLAEVEENQILNGSGTGENLTGILNTSGIQTQALSSTVAGVDSKTETSLKARTKVLTTGRAIPTAYVLNPLDWEAISLARLAKNPQNEGTANATPVLHGLPVVQSEAIAVGTGLVGDFRKAVIWDREQATISATDSHADFFIRNLVAILGEERLAFGVLRPKAFCRFATA